ncbi:HAD-like domain-containing protein [Syncephalastrum racemosum]|uniref:HAD-like domain-containing protein n=1 Tax=Syncephalastrum racemosum TaxID=13706 RepID=A0A1X2H8M5_SYNRA|nr:HAD-like domain-containing protein [Syncephalastrum racemosum]
MRFITNLSSVVSPSKSQYKTLAIDIYGVLHNGSECYPYSRASLENLTQAGIHTILLSNSTRLGYLLARDLEGKYGIKPASYSEILSSGELTKIFLEQCFRKELQDEQQSGTATCHATAMTNGQQTTMAPSEFAQQYIKTGKFYLVGKESYHAPLFEHLEPHLTRVHADEEGYDFVLLGMVVDLPGCTTSVDPLDEKSVQEHYRPFLTRCLERRSPFVCANPDVWAPNGNKPDGSPQLLACPGYIGKLYESMGGTVLYFGKPFPSIYKYLVAMSNVQKDILCIGDNLATDVAGARQAGLDVAMVLGGIHSSELGSHTDVESKLDELCKKYSSPEPTYVIPYLKYE